MKFARKTFNLMTFTRKKFVWKKFPGKLFLECHLLGDNNPKGIYPDVICRRIFARNIFATPKNKISCAGKMKDS
jgi:hypothetical protein